MSEVLLVTRREDIKWTAEGVLIDGELIDNPYASIELEVPLLVAMLEDAREVGRLEAATKLGKVS